MKIAAYLDSAGDTPEAACQTLQKCDINHVVIREVWTGNICNLSDSTCQKLKNIIDEYSLSIPMIASDLGFVNCDDLKNVPSESIDRALFVAKYFKADYIRIFCGLKDASENKDSVGEWMALISSRCASAGITPMLEMTSDFPYSYNMPVLLELLNNNKYWRVLYDPTQLIVKRNIDPFDKCWKSIKNFVAAIDVNDYKIGHGFKTVGAGDSMIKQTINDSKTIKYNGWYFTEFNFGKRIFDGLNKQDMFKENYNQFLKMIK